MKARMKFTKTGSMVFIGHLDVMRYFQKAFRRAEIEIAYSEGFSPHQIMSFASPLGLGITSDAEYLDVTLRRAGDKKEMLARLNEQMNGEIQVTDFIVLREEAKPSMAVFAAADYLVSIRKGYEVPENFRERFRRFLAQEEIRVMKKTKKSEKEIDIRPFIYYAAFEKEAFSGMTGNRYPETVFEEAAKEPLVYMQLTAGSITNIKPELVMEAFCKEEGIAYNPFAFSMHRLEMYADADAVKGEVHTLTGETPCRLVPLSVWDAEELP